MRATPRKSLFLPNMNTPNPENRGDPLPDEEEEEGEARVGRGGGRGARGAGRARPRGGRGGRAVGAQVAPTTTPTTTSVYDLGKKVKLATDDLALKNLIVKNGLEISKGQLAVRTKEIEVAVKKNLGEIVGDSQGKSFVVDIMTAATGEIWKDFCDQLKLKRKVRDPSELDNVSAIMDEFYEIMCHDTEAAEEAKEALKSIKWSTDKKTLSLTSAVRELVRLMEAARLDQGQIKAAIVSWLEGFPEATTTIKGKLYSKEGKAKMDQWNIDTTEMIDFDKAQMDILEEMMELFQAKSLVKLTTTTTAEPTSWTPQPSWTPPPPPMLLVGNSTPTPSGRNGRGEINCWTCHKTGHMAERCPEREESAYRAEKCNFCHYTGHTETECRKKMKTAVITCDRCGGQGHVVEVCPSRTTGGGFSFRGRGSNGGGGTNGGGRGAQGVGRTIGGRCSFCYANGHTEAECRKKMKAVASLTIPTVEPTVEPTSPKRKREVIEDNEWGDEEAFKINPQVLRHQRNQNALHMLANAGYVIANNEARETKEGKGDPRSGSSSFGLNRAMARGFNDTM